MKHLIIRNIGPIEEVSIPINKVNLFIGPQSSGKSTIAKILSFCFWLEKYCVINQGSSLPGKEFMKKKLISFHNMSRYFRDDSYIKYVGKWIVFEYKSLDDFSISLGDMSQAYMGKVAYVPSERNVVSIPNISSLDMDENYIRGFVFDWLQIHRKFTSKNELNILNLGVKYFYDEEKGDILSDDKQKEIALSEASSGLQSVVPLIVYLFYATQWIYEHEMDISFDKYSALQKAFLKNIGTDLELDDAKLDVALSKVAIRKAVNNMLEKMSHGMVDESLVQVKNSMDLLSKPHYTKLVLEEPELNLFPLTQYELVKQVVKNLDFERGDNLVITTHSPYIMTSFNNLIQAGNAIADGKDKQNVMDVLGGSCALDFNVVNAWAVADGHVKSINDEEFRLLSTDALDEASVKIGNDFDKLCDYE